MTTRPAPGRLVFCPECRQRWPRGREFDLRGFGWLHDLPRHVTPSNIDCAIHDGEYGRNRILFIETKAPDESMHGAQLWLLRALAAKPDVFVIILRGHLGDLAYHRVRTDGADREGWATSPEAVRHAVSRFLNGDLWRECEETIKGSASQRQPAQPHLCQWAPRDSAGRSVCVVCGETWSVARVPA